MNYIIITLLFCHRDDCRICRILSTTTPRHDQLFPLNYIVWRLWRFCTTPFQGTNLPLCDGRETDTNTYWAIYCGGDGTSRHAVCLMSSYANLITRPSKAICVVIMRVMADTVDVSDFSSYFRIRSRIFILPFPHRYSNDCHYGAQEIYITLIYDAIRWKNVYCQQTSSMSVITNIK